MSAELQPSLASTSLSGWGANFRADCQLAEPETPAEVAAHLSRSGVCPRGLGRSYGDPAVNAGGLVVGMTRLDRYLAFDEATGTLTCEAGVSQEQIIHDFAPRGFFPMITPGTKYVTIGGCIANDIHGKAHHSQGSFSACVDSMRVLLASGDVVTASRTERADLFWASFGGMGLLGIVLDATLKLRKVETTYFHKKAVKAGNLSEMLAALEEFDASYTYSVANVDGVASGARLGRGVVTFANHADVADLPAALARAPLHVSKPAKLVVPFELPEFTFNPLTIRLIHRMIELKLMSGGDFDHYEGVFYPLDFALHWNRGYGRRGFTQYQFVVPFEDGERRMHEILTTIMASGEYPSLNVLKRFGKASDGPLSFPTEGFTFAIDFPIRDTTVELTRRLDAMVLDAGGRVYLGKDSFVSASTFRAMYPRLDEWLAIKAKYDPDCVFVSDLGRRVGLVPAR
jgi:decaprenylphospho-beta-D-ribofuranose 2-oxidase